MVDNYVEKVNNFIELLKNFNGENLARGKYLFNPWTMVDETDLDNGAQIRTQNLKQYLLDKKNANYIFIAESPSKGARYTGIAMTSEKAISDYKLPYDYSSLNYKKYKKGESTANKVWFEISKSNNTFVFWNAFAFNIHISEGKWFENPTDEELVENKYILESFLNLYPKAKIVAVGNTARKALELLKIENIEGIRHPSNDFKKEFPLQIKKFL